MLIYHSGSYDDEKDLESVENFYTKAYVPWRDKLWYLSCIHKLVEALSDYSRIDLFDYLVSIYRGWFIFYKGFDPATFDYSEKMVSIQTVELELINIVYNYAIIRATHKVQRSRHVDIARRPVTGKDREYSQVIRVKLSMPISWIDFKDYLRRSR